MILPPRPLGLRPEFVRTSWLRAVGSFAPMLALLIVVTAWQGRAAWELVQDMRVWSEGEPVAARVLDANVTVTLGVVRRVRIRAEYGRDVITGAGYRVENGQVRVDPSPGARLDHYYTVRDDYFTFFADSVDDAPLELHRDAATGRVALSWAIQDMAGRWAWLLVYGLTLLALAYLLGRYAWRTLRELRIARAAARSSDEVELEIISSCTDEAKGQPIAMEITYRVPPVVDDSSASYREPAATGSAQRTERFVLADGPPLLLDGGSRLLALRPDRRGADVTVVRESFWPFALGEADREAAREAIAGRRRSRGSLPWAGSV